MAAFTLAYTAQPAQAAKTPQQELTELRAKLARDPQFEFSDDWAYVSGMRDAKRRVAELEAQLAPAYPEKPAQWPVGVSLDYARGVK